MAFNVTGEYNAATRAMIELLGLNDSTSHTKWAMEVIRHVALAVAGADVQEGARQKEADLEQTMYKRFVFCLETVIPKMILLPKWIFDPTKEKDGWMRSGRCASSER